MLAIGALASAAASTLNSSCDIATTREAGTILSLLGVLNATTAAATAAAAATTANTRPFGTTAGALCPAQSTAHIATGHAPCTRHSGSHQ